VDAISASLVRVVYVVSYDSDKVRREGNGEEAITRAQN
jgi:hypothetical protein